MDTNTIMNKASIPVCCTTQQYKMIEEFAKRNGMLNTAQALENILESIKTSN